MVLRVREKLEVNPNGLIVTQTVPAQQIVEILHLNDREYVFRRSQMLALFDELRKYRPDLYLVWLGYPYDLPDLSHLRPLAETTAWKVSSNRTSHVR